MDSRNEFYDKNYFEQFNRSKNAALVHGYEFHEWSMNFKNINRRLFSGKTARKTLSNIPFSETFIKDEQDEITKCCKAIFPDRIWIGTSKEQQNTAKVWFSNTYDDGLGKFINVFDLYSSPQNVRSALSNIGAANPAVCLSTFTGKNNYRGCIYSVNAIAVNVDYKNNGFTSHNGKQKVIEILKKEHFGKTMPIPTFIVDEDLLTLVFVFKEPAYVYKHGNGIRFFEWMSKVFADRISYLGGKPVKANGLVVLPEAAICHGSDRKVRQTAEWIPLMEKTDHTKLHEWLTPMEEKKKECPWYKTKKELKGKKKKKWDPSFAENNKQVLEDLVAIRNYYCEKGISWQNKNLLFIYSVYAQKIFGKNAKRAALDFANGFCEPLPEGIVMHTINCSMAKEYRYKNRTILSVLGITEDMDICLYMLEAKKKRREYQKKWKQKKQSSVKKEKKNMVSKTIKRLREEGKKNIEILKILIKSGFTMSFKTLERYITIMIKNGDIMPRMA